MAEANLNNKLEKNVISNFQKALECAVCLEVVKKPFKQCATGHLVCVPCVKTLPSCPTCKEELLLENPVCIQNLLEFLPRACCYAAGGCKATVQDGDDHEKFCGFRSICCIHCEQNVLAKELFNHLNTVHTNIFMIENESIVVHWPAYTQSKIYSILYVLVLDKIFFISMDNSNDEELQISFESVPVGNMEGVYYAKITFSKEKIDYVYTLKAFPSEDSSKTNEGKNKVKRPENCMKVPKSMLSNFLAEDGSLRHSVIVFRG